ncbi:MAG TPA: cytochrome ubiquinol oxidase subunit I [Fermentimonas caenicola]|jgi:cytochrome d ubiquinol oxidase subunit I|uniref:Cytochrome bd quinol oxidase subunit 1 n=1 Tax=Fermentimonas caenicola TaxID=1562970 RepID=A0A098C1J4_9BACT|nr:MULTISPECIES: cytochrome ubiquinol oxidase subunit I [Lascolabacillus]MBP6174773.1 cytochrome ubiquinol oxidase subunit I [Fermentimonas sp.]MDI9626715.1 cytochrome ubiquinol oxidase subunit I [Bacteroidota bacterium]TAH61210.1 MAG: cytochrome ubiquinol oxidase subunit I [Fermentimonas caenicola]MBP6197560.1 cytochrome ubiquinol oxidase subunit I [Fermentimonas sp.]MBP7103955.1 cytochrome ubiquinol oxidase subunit I [Fermentimonas sp.]
MDFLLNAATVNWSRGQFALTAMYHWIFVPLTIGLALIMAIMESIYVRTGDEKWKNISRFWQKIFGINFAIGIATGIILEFQFGTNWSNYSWFVGDIFGAPLAIEGIVAFFLEATFVTIMFFGWNRVSKGVHLLSTWMVFLGATLSALWILVANAWMQHPVGMEFNPDTVRNEMVDFWAVALSPVAINKFLHTVFASLAVGSSFVVGVSAWYLLKNRHIDFALKSIKLASIVGLITFLMLAFTGDGSAYEVSQKQPMKLAAMEGLYEGKEGAGLVMIGMLNPSKKVYNDDADPYLFKMEIPKLLSLLGYRDINAFVPGIKDIIDGGYTLQDGSTALSFEERKARGELAIKALADYQMAKKAESEAIAAGNSEAANIAASEAANYETILRENYEHFGYGYLETGEDLVPDVPLTFYSFHLMVMIGMYFILFFMVILFFQYKKDLRSTKWLLYIALWSIPLSYIAGQLGWLVAEVGRQPWTIQDILPVEVAASALSPGHVITTFVMFAVIFTVLLIAEVTIMVKQIKKGPEEVATEIGNEK